MLQAPPQVAASSSGVLAGVQAVEPVRALGGVVQGVEQVGRGPAGLEEGTDQRADVPGREHAQTQSPILDGAGGGQLLTTGGHSAVAGPELDESAVARVRGSSTSSSK